MWGVLTKDPHWIKHITPPEKQTLVSHVAVLHTANWAVRPHPPMICSYLSWILNKFNVEIQWIFIDDFLFQRQYHQLLVLFREGQVSSVGWKLLDLQPEFLRGISTSQQLAVKRHQHNLSSHWHVNYTDPVGHATLDFLKPVFLCGTVNFRRKKVWKIWTLQSKITDEFEFYGHV